MYAKIWHINAFDMHSITSLSPEKILLAKPEYIFFYWLSEFLQPNRNQFLQPLNSVILMPKFLQCLFKMIFFQWIFLKTDLFSLMVLNRQIWPGVCLLKPRNGRCCWIHAQRNWKNKNSQFSQLYIVAL